MNLLRELNETKQRLYYRIARGVAVIAGIFTLVISSLLIVNYIQAKTYDPGNAPVIEELITKASKEPDNQQLKELVRELDLLARKAYFTNIAFANFGAYLLLGWVILLLIGLQAMQAFTRKLPQPGKLSDQGWELARPPNPAAGNLRVKLILAGLGGVLVIVALLVPILFPADWRDLARAKNTVRGNTLTSVEMNGLVQKNWPNFRGPWGNGVTYQRDIPTDWDGSGSPDHSGGNTGAILWKLKIPQPGPNSPIVWGNKLFLTGNTATQGFIYSIDTDSGQMLWQTKVNFPEQMPSVSADTGFSAATMATDGQYLFAIFADGQLLGLDYQGKILWSRSLGTPRNQYGYSSSLLADNGLLFIQFDQQGDSKVLALHPANGKTVWEQTRPVSKSWASPIIAKVGNHLDLILTANPWVIAYDPLNGKERWRIKCLSGDVAPSPASAGGLTFVATEYASLTAIDNQSGKMVWENSEVELPDVASLLATPDYVFVPTASGLVTCIQAKTGAVLWEHEFDRGFYASPILVGDQVYMLDRSGVMHIIKAGREFQEVASPAVGEPVDATPAFMAGRIYIRGKDHLFCIGTKSE